MRSAGFGKCLMRETHRVQNGWQAFTFCLSSVFYVSYHLQKLPVAGSVGDGKFHVMIFGSSCCCDSAGQMSHLLRAMRGAQKRLPPPRKKTLPQRV